MTATDKMTDEDFERHALAILQRELAPEGLARFLSLHGPASVDYTRDRHRWLNGITIDQIVAEAEHLATQKSLTLGVSLTPAQQKPLLLLQLVGEKISSMGLSCQKRSTAEVRGGSWNNNPRNVRVSNRNRNEPANRNNSIGFRCAGYAERDSCVGQSRQAVSSLRVC